MREFRLAHLPFGLDGRDPILPPLLAELAPLAVEPSARPRLVFDFGGAFSPMDGAVIVPPLRVSSDRYEARHDRLAYQVSREEGCLRVVVRSEVRLGKSPEWLTRFKDWNYLLPAERAAKNFMYGVFDYLSQLALLELESSYIHASSFERDGRGVGILAWGGIGKTTAMLKLVLEDGWRFLSDDLGLIDTAGALWRVPKRMQIYAYNLAGEERLEAALMAGRSRWDRASWSWRLRKDGPKGVRRRVSAEELFGPEAVGRTARAERLFFLERTAGAAPGFRAAAPEELARRSASILLEELKPFVTIASALHSTGYRPVLPTVSDLHARTVDVLTKAFSRSEGFLLQVPAGAGPAQLADELRRRIA